MSEQREGEGRYSPTVSDDTLLHYFERGQRDFHSANEIAAEFGLDRSQAPPTAVPTGGTWRARTGRDRSSKRGLVAAT